MSEKCKHFVTVSWNPFVTNSLAIWLTRLFAQFLEASRLGVLFAPNLQKHAHLVFTPQPSLLPHTKFLKHVLLNRFWEILFQ